MAVFVRKLNNRKNIDSIRNSSNVEDTPADAVTSEFRTKNNTLPVWQVSDHDSAEQGILAIALSSSSIDTMDFVLLEEERLKETGLNIVQTPSGKNPYADAGGMHFDISDICLKSLSDICKLYKCTDDKYIVRKTKNELKKLILQAHGAGLINIPNANDNVKKDLEKLGIA
jgi:hypothetical protein